MRKFLILACLTALAGPVLAEDVFQRPPDCQLQATAQMDSCEVENYYSCPAADRKVYRQESFDSDGLYAVTLDDPINGVTSTDFMWSDGSFSLQYTGDQPDDILRKGTGATSGAGEFMAFGLRRPFSASETLSYSGDTQELAGRLFQILKSEAKLQLPYPIPEINGSSTYAYNPELDLLITIESSSDVGISEDTSSKLVELSLPGQPGFGEESPRYSCAEISSLSAPNASVRS